MNHTSLKLRDSGTMDDPLWRHSKELEYPPVYRKQRDQSSGTNYPKLWRILGAKKEGHIL